MVAAVNDQDWPDSVKSLAAGFPELINRMAEHSDWTETMGEALVSQTDDVLVSIQRLRAQAQVNGYLADLESKDLIARPVPVANHIAWQLGHVIAAERFLVEKAVPGKMDALPEGFVDRHKKGTAASDNAADFLSKDGYLELAGKVRANTLRVVESLSPTDFDQPASGGPPFVTNVGQALLFISHHWMMHAGQWAVIRRKLGRPPLF